VQSTRDKASWDHAETASPATMKRMAAAYDGRAGLGGPTADDMELTARSMQSSVLSSDISFVQESSYSNNMHNSTPERRSCPTPPELTATPTRKVDSTPRRNMPTDCFGRPCVPSGAEPGSQFNTVMGGPRRRKGHAAMYSDNVGHLAFNQGSEASQAGTYGKDFNGSAGVYSGISKLNTEGVRKAGVPDATAPAQTAFANTIIFPTPEKTTRRTENKHSSIVSSDSAGKKTQTRASVQIPTRKKNAPAPSSTGALWFAMSTGSSGRAGDRTSSTLSEGLS